MTRRLIYLIGEPGVGKTTTMACLTARWKPLGELTGPTRTLYGDKRGLITAVELGRRRPGGFSGTDALPMDAIDTAELYVKSGRAAAETTLLLAEGARLANRRFLQAGVQAGWDTNLVYLDNPDVAKVRRAARGSEQNPAWVKGAATRAAFLAHEPPPGVTVHHLDASPSPIELAATIAELIPAAQEAA